MYRDDLVLNSNSNIWLGNYRSLSRQSCIINIHLMSENALAIKLKQRGVDLLRRAGLLTAAEQFRYRRALSASSQDNRVFRREHPEFIPPPLLAMYDAYATVSFRHYQETGLQTARVIAALVNKWAPNAEAVFEWGCGPARVIRNLPSLLPQGTRLFGTDYNKESIAWCRRVFKNIYFADNELAPPLPFGEKSFDVIYAISVLTHLSVEQQKAWIQELRRVLRPNGCLILTTHGEDSAKILLPYEHAQFQKNGVVIRSGVQEGKRCYLAYHHPGYARDELFAGLNVREHITRNPIVGQDIWVLQ
jgi:SAM-dependent methyltransferase